MTWLGVPNSGEIYYGTDENDFFLFGTHEGDVKGGLKDTIVSGLVGFPISSGPPSSGQILKFDGSEWDFSTDISANHNLLSATHSDTTPENVTRGAIIYGSGASPSWARLPLGTAEFVLYSDGTDVLYTRLGAVTPFSLGTSAAPSMTFTGDLDTGWAAENPDQLTGSASGLLLLTLNGQNGSLNFSAGQVVKTRVHGTGNTNVSAADYVVAITGTPSTTTLLASPEEGQVVIIKDRDGQATAGSFITIDANGGTIDGNSTIKINKKYGSFTLLYSGTEWNII